MTNNLLENVLSRISDFVDFVDDKVHNAINTGINTVAENVESIKDTVTSWYDNIIDGVSNSIGNIWSNVTNWIDSKIDLPFETTKEYEGTINQWIDNTINNISNTLSIIWSNIIDWINRGISSAHDIISSIPDKIRDFINDFVSGIPLPPMPPPEIVQSIPSVVSPPPVTPTGGGGGGMENLLNIFNLVPNIVEFLKLIIKNIEAVNKSINNLNPEYVIERIMPIVPLVKGIYEIVNTIKEPIKDGQLTDDMRNMVTVASVIGMTVGAPMGFLPVVNDAYSAGIGQLVQQYARMTYRPTKLALDELISARRRGLIDEQKLLSDGSSHGLSDDDIDIAYRLTEQIFDVSSLITLWQRKSITDTDFSYELNKLGYSTQQIGQIKTLAQTIPGIQDLIRFAVREAFTPEIAEKFGQYQDYPEKLTDYAKLHGLSEEFARMYWSAHWDLPSATMGFEMLHRQIISEDELKLLLRALDIMPFWRDKLIQLSYTPLTRVDIRRMHKLGVITDDELPIRYQHIGYSPTDAKLLADFTIKYNSEPETQEETDADRRRKETRDLSRGDILSAYADQLMDVDTCRNALINIGYSTDEANFLLTREDFKREQKLLNLYIDAYHDGYVRGIYNDNDIIGYLGQLNLPGKYINEKINLWSIERELRRAHPTKSELLGWYRRRLISREIVVDELHAIGYDDKWIDLYLKSPEKGD